MDESNQDPRAEDVGLVGRLAQAYDRHPAWKALLGMVVGGGALGPLLEARAGEILDSRRRAFFEELGRGGLELSEELLRSDEFVHAFFATAAAATRARRIEKVRYLARLLQGAVENPEVGLGDLYEELLASLEDLSWREIALLEKLDRWNHEVAEAEGVTLARARAAFREEVLKDLGLESEEIVPAAQRLTRSGFLQVPITEAGDEGHFGIGAGDGLKYGEVTSLYRRLEKAVKNPQANNGA